MTTQVFDLGDTVGQDTIVTSGFELIDVDVAVERAIVGGTGVYGGVDRPPDPDDARAQQSRPRRSPACRCFGVSLSVELVTE